jgi:hypothetical protein
VLVAVAMQVLAVSQAHRGVITLWFSLRCHPMSGCLTIVLFALTPGPSTGPGLHNLKLQPWLGVSLHQSSRGGCPGCRHRKPPPEGLRQMHLHMWYIPGGVHNCTRANSHGQ